MWLLCSVITIFYHGSFFLADIFELTQFSGHQDGMLKFHDVAALLVPSVPGCFIYFTELPKMVSICLLIVCLVHCEYTHNNARPRMGTRKVSLK